MKYSINRKHFLQLATALSGFFVLPQSIIKKNNQTINRTNIGSETYFPGYSLYEALKTLKYLGFCTVELHAFGVPEAHAGMTPGFDFKELTMKQKDTITEAIDDFKHISVHLPYSGLNFFSSDREYSQQSIKKFEYAMEGAAYFKAELATFHIMEPEGRELENAWEDIIKQCRIWGDMGAEMNLPLAIETGFPNSAEQFIQLIRDIDHPWVGVNVDVGHQIWYDEFSSKINNDQLSTKENIKSYNDLMHYIIDNLSDKLMIMHVHDIDPETWSEHRSLKYDTIDYPRLFRKLKDINYDSFLIFEIAPPNRPPYKPAVLANDKRKMENFMLQ